MKWLDEHWNLVIVQPCSLQQYVHFSYINGHFIWGSKGGKVQQKMKQPY
jgi:hypothetical protein